MLEIKQSLRPILATCFMLLLGISVLFGQEYYEEPPQETYVKEVPTTPIIRGVSPMNGSENLLRNAYVSARMELLDTYQGVDPKSVSYESIRLYPAHEPEKPVEIFITINNKLKNILLEPEDVLNPNTEYVFEVNSNLLDKKGVPFKAYQSRFKTGDTKIPKHINKDKPKIRVIPHKRRVRLNPLPEGYLIKKKKPVETPKPTPEEEALIAEKKAEEEKKNMSPQELKKATLEDAVAKKLAEYKASQAKKEQAKLAETEAASAEKPVAEKPSLEDAVAKKLAEYKASKAQKAAATPPENVSSIGEKPAQDSSAPPAAEKLAESPKAAPKVIPSETAPPSEENVEKEVAEKAVENLPTVNKITYKVSQVKKDRALPVHFALKEKVQIKYMIKNNQGKIVKRGVGTVEPGISDKSISTRNLPPGKYKIAIKVNNLLENHSFTILKK